MLSLSDIKKISTLARLQLSDSEATQYRRELAAIIGYIDKLSQARVATKVSVVIKSSSTSLRVDKARAWLETERETAFKQFPDAKGRHLKVRRILA